MRWFLPRLLGVLLAALVTGALGFALGPPGAAWPCALAGSITAGLAIAAFDVRRAPQFVDWLQGSRHEGAPRDAGRWGEIAYRTERELRALEQAVQAERSTLGQFRAAMEASPNGVLLLDGNDVIEWCNARAADHFGLDPQRDRNQHITNLIRSPAFVAYLQTGNFSEPMPFGAPDVER